MRDKLVFLLLFFCVFGINFISEVNAQEAEFDHVIVNSENWQDVYSVMHYAKLKGAGSDFLVSTRHGSVLLNGLSKSRDVRVINSASDGFVFNYESVVRAEGFSDVDGITVRNANIELIDDLEEVRDFVVIGDTYGYNAIAVAPYAVLNNAWVFFADRTNIDEIDAILGSRNVDEVLVYGFVDREVREVLSDYDAEVIDNGDRFEDNIEIVERYLEINPTQQVLLSNGEFIERELLSGSSPVLFTGKENVPDQISDYIRSSDIEVGVLVGADLVGSATNIRRGTGISVIVKFARGARAPTGAIAAVEGLDQFYLPIPIMELDLHSAKYNRATSQLEITYRSDSNIPIFFKGTITPISESGESSRIGDTDAVFIAPNDFKTVAYPDLEFSDEDFSLEVFTLYGDTPSSLEKILEKQIEVESVNVIDRCEIGIVSAKYSLPKDSFVVRVENTGGVDCYVDVELNDVLIEGIAQTLGSEGSVMVSAGNKESIVIEQEMSDDDLVDNDFVEITAYYGEREDSLIKILKGRFELRIESVSFAMIGLSILGLIIIIAIIFLLIAWRRRKDDDF